MSSCSGERQRPKWSVFDDVKNISAAAPEALMADINTAISALEYARAAAAFLPSSQPKTLIKS